MKKTLIILGGALAASSVSASAVVTLVAGWDAFSNSAAPEASAATFEGTGTTAVLSGTTNWDDWSNASGHGSSIDGTFGSLSTTIASADTTGTTGSNQGRNLSMGRNNKPGSLTVTVTNTSGLDRTMDSFYFDAVARSAQSADDWDLTFSGAISGTAASGALTRISLNGGVSETRDDWAVDLTGLTDNVWEAGSTATFLLEFSGGPASTNTGTNGGHETLVDNIGITADVIPEPSSTALLGLGTLGLLARRRRNA